MSRDAILGRVREGLRRSAGQPVPDPPPVRLRVAETTTEQRIAQFTAALEALAGKVFIAASSEEAREYASRLIGDGPAVLSASHILDECGISSLRNTAAAPREPQAAKEACAQAAVGVTGATYALADTGTLVMIMGKQEQRLVSLLPPVHLALVRRDRILSGLDELLTLHPLPADSTSAMVLITGPSRTADIEQILVRGVHGPGEIHVVIL